MKRILVILVITFAQTVFSQEKKNNLSLQYEVIARGVYQKMNVNKETFAFSEDRKEKKIDTVKISNKQW